MESRWLLFFQTLCRLREEDGLKVEGASSHYTPPCPALKNSTRSSIESLIRQWSIIKELHLLMVYNQSDGLQPLFSCVHWWKAANGSTPSVCLLLLGTWTPRALIPALLQGHAAPCWCTGPLTGSCWGFHLNSASNTCQWVFIIQNNDCVSLNNHYK